METIPGFKYIEEYYDILREYQNKNKYVESIKLLEEIEAKIFDGEITSRDNKDEDKSDYEVFKENIMIKTISEDKDLIERCQEALKRINTTQPDRSSNNIDSWFTYENDVNTITISSKTIIKCPILKILAMLAEVDLFSKFITRFESIVKLEEYNLFRWLVRIRLLMPVTITNREMIAMGFGCINPEDKTILMPFRSVTNEHYNHIKLPAEDPNFLRIDMLFGFFNIKCIDEETVEVINCYNVNPKVAVIPWFVLNTFLREISYYIMNDLKTQIENADFSVYEERIKKNKNFYDEMLEIVNNRNKK